MAETVDPDQYTTPFALTKTTHREPYPFISAEKPENSQKGKIIIITGGGSGIGAAAAKVWAQAGAYGIVIAGRRLKNLKIVANEIEGLKKETIVLPVETDISVEKSVENLFAQVQKRFGRPADVLLNNAAHLNDGKLFAEQSVDEWWKTIEINFKGLALMLHHYINTQSNPKLPVGTIITVLSGRAGLVVPQGSSYNVSKIAGHRLIEHIQLEYPSLRCFLTMPGIVQTEMESEYWAPFAKDHVDLTGLQALYLAQPRADYLKGSMVGVNWDLEEMEEHKEQIADKKLLTSSWLPVLPFHGGKGLND